MNLTKCNSDWFLFYKNKCYSNKITDIHTRINNKKYIDNNILYTYQ